MAAPRKKILLPLVTRLLLPCFLLVQLVAPPVHSFSLGGIKFSDEKEIGRKFDVMIRSSMPVIEDPEITAYVGGIVERLVKAFAPQPFQFKSSVVLHNALNAFAVPGGYVFVFSGMIMHLKNEDELAGVLAHELAHVTQRHMAARMEKAQYLTLATLLLAIAGIAAGGSAGSAVAVGALGAGQSAMLNYSRLDETEADQIGLQYLTSAGYSPYGMVGGFQILRQKTRLAGANIPTYLSTHPAIGERINGLKARIEGFANAIKMRPLTENRFRRVKTLLWGRYGDAHTALSLFTGNDALSHMGRGMVQARQNRIGEAMQSFDASLALAPDDGLINREAGIFHYRKGDLARAEKLLQTARRMERRDYLASFFYARLLADTRRHREAQEQFRDVLRFVPEEPEVHDALAQSLAVSGRTGEAYIHLAYGAIYANNRRQAQKYIDKARAAASSQYGKKLAILERVYKERQEIWESR